MRMMLKFQFPTDPGNEVIRSGKINTVFQKLMQDLKPEAAYFYPEAGQRAGMLVFDVQDSSQLVNYLEPFWFALGADIEIVPVMNADDLMKGLSGIQTIISNYG